MPAGGCQPSRSCPPIWSFCSAESARYSTRRACRSPPVNGTAALSTAAPASGTLTRLDALAVGRAAWRLGAGRARKEDEVQAAAGIVWHARPGDTLTEGQPLFTLHTDEPERFDRALESLEGGYDVGEESAYTARPLVIERVE